MWKINVKHGMLTRVEFVETFLNSNWDGKKVLNCLPLFLTVILFQVEYSSLLQRSACAKHEPKIVCKNLIAKSNEKYWSHPFNFECMQQSSMFIFGPFLCMECIAKIDQMRFRLMAYLSCIWMFDLRSNKTIQK